MKLKSETFPVRAIILLIAGVMALIFMFSGCAKPSQEDKSAQVVPPQSTTSVPTQAPPDTPTVNLQDESATKIAELDQQHHAAETRIAGLIGVTVTPFVIATALPMPTPVLGISGECMDGNGIFTFAGCWVGETENGYVFVSSGAPTGDPNQGAIIVYTTTLDQRTWSTRQSYVTPERAGVVTISYVDWPVMVVTPVDNLDVRFGFDLVTRQWVSPPPLPSPTASVVASPIATP